MERKEATLCLFSLKGTLKMGAHFVTDEHLVKVFYETDGNLKTAYRRFDKLLPVVAGTNGEEVERLTAAIYRKMTELRAKGLI